MGSKFEPPTGKIGIEENLKKHPSEFVPHRGWDGEPTKANRPVRQILYHTLASKGTDDEQTNL
jgi:hypothetical protein